MPKGSEDYENLRCMAYCVNMDDNFIGRKIPRFNPAELKLPLAIILLALTRIAIVAVKEGSLHLPRLVMYQAEVGQEITSLEA